MHFSKTYTELLLSLPPELRDSAIEYRKLKKLINQVVQELTQLGLTPDVLHQVLLETETLPDDTGKGKGKAREVGGTSSSSPWVPVASSHDTTAGLSRVVYEINTDSNGLEPRLRLLVDTPLLSTTIRKQSYPHRASHPFPVSFPKHSPQYGRTMVFIRSSSESSLAQPVSHPSLHEVIIPLPSDTAFFRLLMQALQALSTQLGAVGDDFIRNLHELSRSIASTARPMSATSHTFTGYSPYGTNPAFVRVPPTRPIIPLLSGAKSDLYHWREIFQMYIDLEVFENHRERSRGERSVEDAEQRLETFKQRLAARGFVGGRTLRMKQSREAMEKFVRLNTFILDLKKFQFATTEATRKILKKHAKRTALPFSPSLLTVQQHPSDLSSSPMDSSALVLSTRPSTSLAHMLVQAVGETILPVIPHIDDYACAICTSIAFKPIRLFCGHLFCYRCLVKMQKRGQGDCPMCRAPTVLQADRSNVDWALLNFMKDWFPIEAREKLQQSEREAAEDQMRELGFKTDGPACVLM
ncbi:hypothetical protein BC835DRAFT_1284270 [Cytidiella melzeri]|nr:hypothetical protein BC835DRAFT_1284270 [Cytidiella melzeri]